MIENKLDGNYRWVTRECQNAVICVLKWPGRDASIALLSSLCFGMFYSKRALEVWRGQLSIFPALVQAPSVLLAAVLCRCEEQRRSQSWPNHWEFLFQPLVRSLWAVTSAPGRAEAKLGEASSPRACTIPSVSFQKQLEAGLGTAWGAAEPDVLGWKAGNPACYSWLLLGLLQLGFSSSVCNTSSAPEHHQHLPGLRSCCRSGFVEISSQCTPCVGNRGKADE